MRPFSWIKFEARWLCDALRLRAQTTSTCLRPPTCADQAYFIRGYLLKLLSRWNFGSGETSNTRRSFIANVGKVRGGREGPKGPSGGGSGGSGSVLHGAGTSGETSATDAKVLNESIVAHIARRYGYRDTTAATLSRQSVQRVLALRQCVPLLGFAGVCLVDKPTVITPDEELEGVCVEIRRIFDKINFDIFNRQILPVPADRPVNLSNFKLGSPIAKGCNAVVYSAKLREEQESDERSSASSDFQRIPTIEEEQLDADDSKSSRLSSSPPRKYAAELEAPAGSINTFEQDVPSGPLGVYNLAMKMMFNYDAESNAAAIWQSLSRECAPLQTASFGQQNSLNESPLASREANLPPHPCIVDVKAAFVDRVPLLRGATQLYPVALPPRLHEHGIGRNATMFLVMKRYHCSLRSYLRSGTIERSNRPEHVRLSLCAQLFEAVAHLVSHGIVHRDMKSDNILVELPGKTGKTAYTEPRIALSDFGCCLIPADCISPLKLSFVSGQVSRGGNVALMPPEVQLAKPGLLSFIDYSKADLWSAATLIYEVYGQRNPFFEGMLHPRTYMECDLPVLDKAPLELRVLVTACLQREPSRRPTPAVAATVLQLMLYAPTRLLKTTLSQHPFRALNVRDVVEWLCDMSVDSLFAARREEDREKPCSADQMLKRTFLGRVQLRTVIDALKFIYEAREAAEVDDDEVEMVAHDIIEQREKILAEVEKKYAA
ncbi:serine/threonine-protein kinase PINK1, mitochondrial-like [Varroa jacobsoni]|uniref:serine/threonine-protein kinase PINK1, mitochondrial-like n=1 Tax=Varroa jacobsoni TaxID=62625 RepID=UPI000BF583D0|nr:serine/threonine-protein kinase PINK1, mitochondrial-like [Varroa jacobsoni]XP_022697858.1 serine/threonine-protein kinase PINK1, mitochondrial-like [Varroa jacobsoni]XP_022697859.1 serine/threonine-protein kinase PINK1, mitochondrial-like [Varroa jacobsoni]